MRLHRLHRGLRLAVLTLGVLTMGIGTVAAVTPEQIRRALAAEFGVDVLDIREVVVDGRRLYVVTLMFPEADSNAAFQVGELWLDAETGEPVPRLIHRSQGYELPPPRVGGVREPPPDALRDWTFQGPPPR